MTRILGFVIAAATCLATVLVAVARAQGPQAVLPPSTFAAHASTQDPAVLVTPQRLVEWESALSNWGRWGPDDQRGTLNLITPAKTRAAASLVIDGVSVSLGHFVTEEEAIDSQTFAPTEHWMTRVDPQTGEVLFALDAMSFSMHDGQLSHMDALCHYRTERNGELLIFNGYRQNLDQDGCKDLAIDRMGAGYVTRGVLVDMPLLRGVEWLEPSTPIYTSDLEAWEEFAGVTIESGDVLLVRTGRWAKREQDGPWDYAGGGAGLHASVLPWLRERGVAMLVGDAVNDVQPSGVEGIRRPVHQMTQVFIGLPLVDNGYLEDVAREAAQRDRWAFMVSWQITKVPGGTAGPFNGLATF
ncbi:MAG: cyclase family protein [Gammaproteobacteria bacterium]|nr:cyclase family protein [Gammaproteobacteria bacterium]